MQNRAEIKEVLHQPCLHPAGVIRLLRAIAERREKEKNRPKTWWERFKDMWRTL